MKATSHLLLTIFCQYPYHHPNRISYRDNRGTDNFLSVTGGADCHTSEYPEALSPIASPGSIWPLRAGLTAGTQQRTLRSAGQYERQPSGRTRYEALKASRTCVHCAEAPAATGVLCVACAEYNSSQTRQRRASRHAAGMCPSCAGPSCGECADCRRARSRARSQGAYACSSCGAKGHNRQTCERAVAS